MKSRLIHIATILFLFLVSSTAELSAQFAPKQNFAPLNLDGDFQQLRFNLTGNVRYTADDYIQYSPYAALLITKACGVPSRSTWGGLAVKSAFSVATMAGVVNLLKYTVRRPRPDLSAANSFPSGHSATVFTGAHMLHKEFGHISPWISIGGYTVATATAISRVINNRHWVTDTFAGAAIGIASVELGYWLGDLVFKKSGKGTRGDFEAPELDYDFDCDKHYNFSLLYYYRMIVSSKEQNLSGDLPCRGSGMALEGDIPLVPACGLAVRAGATSLRFLDSSVEGGLSSGNLYDVMLGGFWNYAYPHIQWLELELRLFLGGGWFPGNETQRRGGLSVSGGGSVNFIPGNNFKLRILAEWQAVSWNTKSSTWLNAPLVGISTGFYF